MWTVLESTQTLRELTRIPAQIREKYEAWKKLVTNAGPDGLRAIMGFHDEALAAPWAGSRSSRLSRDYRVIYKVQRDVVRVTVQRVSKHDYRR